MADDLASAPVVTSRRAALIMAATACAIMSLGCRYSPPHPPTFADFQRLGPGILEDEQKLKAQVALFEAALFVPQDIERIRAKGNAQELVGAALQTKIGDENVVMLVHEAWLRGSNDPVVLSGIAKSLIRQIANQQEVPFASTIYEALTALERLDPDDGLPLCLRAYLQLKQGDTNAARLSLNAAVQKSALRLRGPELRRCVTQAAIAAKYPRYTASMLAIGMPGFSVEISIVGKQLLNDANLDRATAQACLELGRRHEAQATLFIEQLIAFSLQKRALELLKPPRFQDELQRMQDVKDKMKKAIAFVDSARAHAASERQWLAYFDTLFERSEFEAVNQLAAMLDYKL